MPTYEYQCQSCGHLFEKYQTITARPVGKCPECGKKVKRLIGAGSGIISKSSSSFAGPEACSSCEPDKPACGQNFPCAGGGCGI